MKTTATKNFAPGGSASWLDNLSPDLGGGREESKKAMGRHFL